MCFASNEGSGHQEFLPINDFDARFDRLADEWSSQCEKDLEVRHKTGALLNGHLGAPNTRNERGAEVIKRATERLGITKSDMSRMRWFAYLFSSVHELRDRYSKLKSWTAVRDLLPTLKPETKGKEKALGIRTTSRVAGKVKSRKLKNADSLLKQYGKLISGVTKHLTEADKVELTDKIKAFVKEMHNRLSL